MSLRHDASPCYQHKYTTSTAQLSSVWPTVFYTYMSRCAHRRNGCYQMSPQCLQNCVEWHGIFELKRIYTTVCKFSFATTMRREASYKTEARLASAGHFEAGIFACDFWRWNSYKHVLMDSLRVFRRGRCLQTLLRMLTCADTRTRRCVDTGWALGLLNASACGGSEIGQPAPPPPDSQRQQQQPVQC